MSRLLSLTLFLNLCSSASSVVRSSDLADIGPAPEVRLRDQRDRAFDLAKLRGKCVLVSFVFTTCNGTCPLTSARMAECRDALKAADLWGSGVEFVSITLDPAHDSPEVLALYSGIYHADPATWHFLTGEPGDVNRVVQSWGMWARRDAQGTLDHPSRVFLVDPQGRQREIYNLDFLTPGSVVQDVKGLLHESPIRPGR